MPPPSSVSLSLDTSTIAVLPDEGSDVWDSAVWATASAIGSVVGIHALNDTGKFMDLYYKCNTVLARLKSREASMASVAAEVLVSLIEQDLFELAIEHDGTDQQALAMLHSRQVVQEIALAFAMSIAVFTVASEENFDFTQAGTRTVAIPVKVTGS